jgi:hypothetical protein
MADIEKPQEVREEHTATSGSDGTELKKTLTIDTVHNDEALKVLATYSGEETWDEKEEKLVTTKIDKRLLPILCATYGLVSFRKFSHIWCLLSNPIVTDYSHEQ